MKKVIIIIILLLIVIFLSIAIYKNEEKYDLKIYFFNAGKADAILISKENKYIMIDTGESSLGDEILEYFKKNKITKLDYLIISHFDKDHVGSASKIIDNVEIGEVLQSNVQKDSKYYINYVESLNKNNIEPKTIENNYSIELKNIKLIVNGPDKIYEKNESNNSSLIVSLFYNENSFLFMGDSENARMKDFIELNDDTYDFIKIPYHGNYIKRLESLIEKIKPKYGVMTCSSKEGCEEETIKLLKKQEVKSYLTKNDSITILSDGKKIEIIQ